MHVTRWHAAVFTGAALVVLAGALSTAPGAAPSRAAAAAQIETINHISPRPNSSGPQPKRLEWTAIKGADSYTVGIWNEVDVRIWKAGNLKSNSVDWPQGLDVDAGTYFWSIIAVRDERPIGDSGLAAFIVVR
jgi:hypothetical protein